MAKTKDETKVSAGSHVAMLAASFALSCVVELAYVVIVMATLRSMDVTANLWSAMAIVIMGLGLAVLQHLVRKLLEKKWDHGIGWYILGQYILTLVVFGIIAFTSFSIWKNAGFKNEDAEIIHYISLCPVIYGGAALSYTLVGTAIKRFFFVS